MSGKPEFGQFAASHQLVLMSCPQQPAAFVDSWECNPFAIGVRGCYRLPSARGGHGARSLRKESDGQAQETKAETPQGSRCR